VSDPLVSAIVPVREGERYLGEALDSILAQDYPRLETIVVDDGSTDGSVALARGRGVRVLEQENAGPGAARNAGVEASSGELLAFLDQDDAWLPGKVRTQVDALRASPDAAYAYARMEVVLEPGCDWPAWLDRGWLAEPPMGYCPGTLMVTRDAFDAVGPFDPDYVAFSDGEWLVRARRAGLGCLLLDDVLLRYRIHDTNHSHDRESFRRELFRALRPSP
jgi:glycosyltransferase involved in cell wall biosynthesis